MKENMQFEKFESEGRFSGDINVTKSTNKINLSLAELKVKYPDASDENLRYLTLYPDVDPKEFFFYQKKFENISKNKLLNKIIGDMPILRNFKSTPVDAAQVEALRDNEDWNRKYRLVEGSDGVYKKELQLEYKRNEERLQSVFGAMKIKRDHPESDEAKKIKILRIDLGGAMKCSAGAGLAVVTNEKGYNKSDGVFLGISGGACNNIYALSTPDETMKKGASHYFEECLTKAFVNFTRFNKIIDVGVIADSMNNRKAVNNKEIQDNPNEFWVQVTRASDGEPQFINAKECKEGSVEAVHASMALPSIIYGKEVYLTGPDNIRTAYRDGSLNRAFPIKKAIELVKPTHVLVVSESPYRTIEEFEKSVKDIKKISKFFPDYGKNRKQVPGPILIKKLAQNIIGLRDGIKEIEEIEKETGIKIGVFYSPDTGIGAAERDEAVVIQTIYETAKRTLEYLDEEMPSSVSNLLNKTN